MDRRRIEKETIIYDNDTIMEELQRLYDWLQDPEREPAQTKFTAGLTRNVAREFEYLLAQLKAENEKLKESRNYWMEKAIEKGVEGKELQAEIDYQSARIKELEDERKKELNGAWIAGRYYQAWLLEEPEDFEQWYTKLNQTE